MIGDIIFFGIWIFLEELVDLLPVKVRRIIGTILLFIGILGLSIAWYGLNQEYEAWDISGIIFIFLGIISLFICLISMEFIRIFEIIFPNGIFPNGIMEDQEYISPESIMKNRKQQIDCPSCNQFLNIPFSYTGMISCPACGIHIKLDEGIIQNEI